MKQDTPFGVLDLFTKQEAEESIVGPLGHRLDAGIRQLYRADSFMRLPLVVAPVIGGAVDFISTVGPNQGYAWDVSLLGISGLTTGNTPDIINIGLDGGPNVAWWQLNGNNFAYTFSRGQFVILPGERISLTSVGTFLAAGPVTLFGMIRTQMPAPKLGAVLA